MGPEQNFDCSITDCMIDIDYFKGCNDSIGHDQGDICCGKSLLLSVNSIF